MTASGPRKLPTTLRPLRAKCSWGDWTEASQIVVGHWSWVACHEPRQFTALLRRILRRLLVGSEFLGYRFQRGIELHKTVLDRRVVLMTLPAGIRRIGLG